MPDHQLRITNRRCPFVSRLPRAMKQVFLLLCLRGLLILIIQCRGSMEPAFYRGDILFLTNPTSLPYGVGDITVYKV